MQNWIVLYVRELPEEIKARDCSIAEALKRRLPSWSPEKLQKFRDGAADLERICVLELMKREDAAEPAPRA